MRTCRIRGGLARWYKQHFPDDGHYPADRDNAREIAWEQELEAHAAGEVPPQVRPNRFGPPFFTEDGF